VLISVEDAAEAAVTALVVAGVPASAARVQAELLVDAESRGLPSHGLLRLPRLVRRLHNGVADGATTGVHTWRSEAFLDVDGKNGLGPVVACAALDALSDRVRRTGVACAAIRSNNHLGALAWYVRAVAERGQAAIALTTSEAIMHPYGGRTAMIGSNPLAIGVPATPRPIVLDMATAVVSMGKVHDYANRGADLEPGWAKDHQGEPTLDATAAKDGSIAPFGGAKGYGLGLALESLVASLTDSETGTRVAGTLDSTRPSNKGDLFIVAEVASARATARVSSYLDEVRAAPRADENVPVSVPGDRSAERRRRAAVDGIEIADQVWRDIVALAAPADPLRWIQGKAPSS